MKAVYWQRALGYGAGLTVTVVVRTVIRVIL